MFQILLLVTSGCKENYIIQYLHTKLNPSNMNMANQYAAFLFQLNVTIHQITRYVYIQPRLVASVNNMPADMNNV